MTSAMPVFDRAEVRTKIEMALADRCFGGDCAHPKGPKTPPSMTRREEGGDR